MMTSIRPRRALLSVSDKTGIIDFARVLADLGIEILSTGGTKEALEQAKIPVKGVEEVTGFPACLDGRLKTLHPTLLGGVLFRRDDPSHIADATRHGLLPIDIVVVNLYPFRTTVQKLGIRPAPGEGLPPEAIEQIDIGGPTLIRAAAKNHDDVVVLCDPSDYARVLSALREQGATTLELRRELAHRAFSHTAVYDGVIATTFSGGTEDHVTLINGRKLRYGENPHQWGMFYEIDGTPQQTWHQIQGKELSYLNLLDGDAAWRMACDFPGATAVMVKHANPSGIATATTIEQAFRKAYDADRLSAFGVIIALNRPCSSAIAEMIIAEKIFVEVLMAPVIEPEAVRLLASKPNIRLLHMSDTRFSERTIYRSACGGMLAQNDDVRTLADQDIVCVTKRTPTDAELRDMHFAWKAVKHAKSNAIVLAKDGVTVGIGCGQTSRVDATWIALKRAGAAAQGAVLASDAFFPFPDSLEEAAKHGVGAVIQPGGSMRDADVLRRADELGLCMVTTGIRGFRH